MSQVTGTEEDENVIVATLIRGKTYTFNHVDPDTKESKGYHTFHRSVAAPVSEELADLLSELVDEVPDSDGELITKDVFRIDRDTPVRSIAPTLRKKRLRIVSEDVEDRPILKAPARKPLAPAGKRPGQFGARKAG